MGIHISRGYTYHCDTGNNRKGITEKVWALAKRQKKIIIGPKRLSSGRWDVGHYSLIIRCKRTRNANESQRPREKWREWNSGEREMGRDRVLKKDNKLKEKLPFFPTPSPPHSFLALVSFLARPKPKIASLGLSVPRKMAETKGERSLSRLMRPTSSYRWFSLWRHQIVKSK